MKLPICTICNKPIDKLTSQYDILNQQHIYAAHCHNEIEITIIPDLLLERATHITITKAFKKTRKEICQEIKKLYS